MFHFDRIQQRVLLIFGAAILLISCVLIYMEYGHNAKGAPEDLPVDQWVHGSDSTADPADAEKEGRPEETEEPEIIMIYITGQVKRPGVYAMTAGQRLDDAIKQAGGCSPQADLNRINLAVRVKDEGMYYIPAVGEEIPADIPALQSGEETERGKININTADQKQLESLTGIGPAKAARIIEYREKHGGFKTIEEIMNVSGMGEKTFDNLKDEICVR